MRRVQWKALLRRDAAPLSFDLLVYGAVLIAILVVAGAWKMVTN